MSYAVWILEGGLTEYTEHWYQGPPDIRREHALKSLSKLPPRLNNQTPHPIY